MRDPVHIFLASLSGSRRVICEALEWSAPLIQVLDLLEDHGLTAHFERSCPVVPKRADGSTIPAPLMTSHTVSEVHTLLQEALARPLCCSASLSICGHHQCCLKLLSPMD